MEADSQVTHTLGTDILHVICLKTQSGNGNILFSVIYI